MNIKTAIRRLLYRWESTGDVHRLVNRLTGFEGVYMEPVATGKGAEVYHDAQLFLGEGIPFSLRIPSELDLGAAKQIAKNRFCEGFCEG